MHNSALATSNLQENFQSVAAKNMLLHSALVLKRAECMLGR